MVPGGCDRLYLLASVWGVVSAGELFACDVFYRGLGCGVDTVGDGYQSAGEALDGRHGLAFACGCGVVEGELRQDVEQVDTP